MAARTTREEARARILAVFAAELDRVIPADETIRLKGATFGGFEQRLSDVPTRLSRPSQCGIELAHSPTDTAIDAGLTARPRGRKEQQDGHHNHRHRPVFGAGLRQSGGPAHGD